MKHLINTIGLMLASLMVLSSCHQPTLQERAETLASEYIKNSLYFPDSYKSTQCKLDSAFAPAETPETMSLLLEGVNLFEQYKDAESDMKHKEEMYELHKSMGNYSSYNVYQTKEAKAKFEEAQAKLDRISEKLNEISMQFQEIKNKPKEFVGWKIVEVFNAQNNGGQTISSCNLLLTDKDLKTVLASYEEDDINKILYFIEEVNQYTE